MNAYFRHIGDFNNATRHLTRVERSVYSDMLDMYYDTEQPLQQHDFDMLARKLLCRSDEEKDALKALLTEFFVLTEHGFSHARCDEEIGKYRANTSAKARAGIASAARRQQKSTGVEQVLEQKSTCVANQNQNQNHKPIDTPKAPKGVSTRFAEFWTTWPASDRKVAKAECEKRWLARGLDADADAIVAHVLTSKNSKQWQGGYEPAPLTFLNQRRWEDGGETAASPAQAAFV